MAVILFAFGAKSQTINCQRIIVHIVFINPKIDFLSILTINNN